MSKSFEPSDLFIDADEEVENYRRQQQRELEQDAQDNFEYYKSGGMFEQILGPMSEEPEKD